MLEEQGVEMGARDWEESIQEYLGCTCQRGHQNLCELDGKDLRGALKVLHTRFKYGKQGCSKQE